MDYASYRQLRSDLIKKRCLLRLDGRSADATSVEEDRPAIDPAVSSAHFQAHVLKLFRVERAFLFVHERSRKNRADQLVEAAPRQADHPRHFRNGDDGFRLNWDIHGTPFGRELDTFRTAFGQVNSSFSGQLTP